MIFSQFNGSSFEDYVTTGIQDRYNIMCSIEDHYIDQPTINENARSGNIRPLTPDLRKAALLSPGITLNFIGSWLE